jgi:hypothetical protein
MAAKRKFIKICPLNKLVVRLLKIEQKNEDLIKSSMKETEWER